MATPTFADLGVSDAVVRALADRGFTEPFAIQRLAIGDILAGRDVLAKSPTGSGKTLAFAVPLADRIAADGPRPTALVLAPTRELASQIVEESRSVCHARALRIAAVYGGVGIHKQARDAAKAHILVATPGRLEDLLERRAVSLSNVRFLVLDEADRMLDMGFRPAVDRIVARCRLGGRRCSSRPRSKARPGASRVSTRVIPCGTSTRRQGAARQTWNTGSWPSPMQTVSTPWSRSCGRSAGSRWCSFAPSAARTAW